MSIPQAGAIRVKTIIFKFGKWLSTTVSKVHIPFARKRVRLGDYNEYLEMISQWEVGDILTTATYGEASNLFIPGEYKHIGWYLGNEKVLEATTEGVVVTYLPFFLSNRDKIAVSRFKFATKEEVGRAVHRALTLIGLPYDFEMNTDNNNWYCSEVIYVKMDEELESRGKDMPFEMRKRLGVLTIAPDDFMRATDKLDVITQLP
jgi:hypothetical protein